MSNISEYAGFTHEKIAQHSLPLPNSFFFELLVTPGAQYKIYFQKANTFCSLFTQVTVFISNYFISLTLFLDIETLQSRIFISLFFQIGTRSSSQCAGQSECTADPSDDLVNII